MKKKKDYIEPYFIISRNNMGYVLGDYQNLVIDIFELDNKGLDKMMSYLRQELEKDIDFKKKKKR